MGARVGEDITVATHYLVMAYIVFGGFLAWRWRWTIVTHIMIICWAVFSLLYPISCPLTLLENYFRHADGLPSLNGGFIDTYLTGVLYPASDVHLVQVSAALIVLVSWVGLVVRHTRRRDGQARRLPVG